TVRCGGAGHGRRGGQPVRGARRYRRCGTAGRAGPGDQRGVTAAAGGDRRHGTATGDRGGHAARQLRRLDGHRGAGGGVQGGARVLRSIVAKVLERVGFDRAVERGGIRAALARSRYDASDLVARLVYYAVLLFTLQLAFGIWGANPVSELIRGIGAWLPKAFVAILIVVVAAAIASAVRDIVGNALSGLSYGRFLAAVAAWFIIGLGVIAALNQVGVATTVTTPILIAVLATIAGILVVGVGGGLVRPMQARWESWLDRAAQESQAIAEHARAYQAGRADAEAAM